MDLIHAAIEAHDRAKLEEYFAPEFIFVHSNGGIETRSHYIDTLLQNRNHLPPAKVDRNAEIREYGDIVVMRNVTRPNVPGTDNINFSTHLIRRQGGIWQQLQTQSTQVPQPK